MKFIEKGRMILSDGGFHLELQGVNFVIYCEGKMKAKAFYESSIDPFTIYLASGSILNWETGEMISVAERKRIIENISKALVAVGAIVRVD
jgi:hypothetical protein